MNAKRDIGVFRPTRRQAGLISLAAILAELRQALAQDELRVVISADDATEIITRDLKRLRLAEPAEFVFVKTDAQTFEQLFPGDPGRALAMLRLRLIVLAAARRAFGDMPSSAVLRGDGTADFDTLINADCKIFGLTLRSHVLRYAPVPPL
jgi:hypothetical protein